mmetsp:Transcript_117818/g.293825  ORF Transcript_117818/g.293825 Transcript_117818/m.293825 type:complete len:594 (+) Transcript_117818:96-1877(+)
MQAVTVSLADALSAPPRSPEPLKVEASRPAEGGAAARITPLPCHDEPVKLKTSGPAGGSFQDMQQPAKVELPRNSPLSSPCSMSTSPEVCKLPLATLQMGLDLSAPLDGSAPSPPPAHLPSVPLRLNDALAAAPPTHSPIVPAPTQSPGSCTEPCEEGSPDFLLPDVPALPLLRSPLRELSSLALSAPPVLPASSSAATSAAALEMPPPGLASFVPLEDCSNGSASHLMMPRASDSSSFGKLQLPLGRLSSEDAFAMAFNLGRCVEMFDGHQLEDTATPASYPFSDTGLTPGLAAPLGSPIDQSVVADLGFASGLPPPIPGALPLGSPTSDIAATDFGLAIGLAPPLPMGSQSCENVMLHNLGRCRPCAWFWKAAGCQNGEDCSYCHLCPAGEIKARKKANQTMMQLGLATPQTRSRTARPRTASNSGKEPVAETETPQKLSSFAVEQEHAVAIAAAAPPSSCPSASPRSEQCGGEHRDAVPTSSSDQESTTGAESEFGAASNSDPEVPNGAHAGSLLHGTGNCKPCAWFWKPVGCQKDQQCSHCHLCPEGERKQRKKSKMFMMRTGIAPQKDKSEQDLERQGMHSLSLAALL